ncbi:MAG TPA: hypothetical protein DEP50_13895 [Acinetobacter lwoffii]|nr:hypothetical protein [Acinetobacter lwoffii]
MMINTVEYADNHNKIIYSLFIITMVIGLYLTTLVNYLLFHSIVELFSIIVAFSVFTITWNSVRYINSPYLLMVGISYLFVGVLDLLHTLAYKGMPIFTDYDYYANQLWIAARYLESITLLAAFALLRTEKKVNVGIVFSCYLVITSLLITSIFYLKIFPICFVDGKGLTDFKIYSEYVICSILVISIVFLVINKRYFTKSVYIFILLSIIYTIISELAFTFYINNYGISNLVGHYFKLFSFMMIYHAIIKTGIDDPFSLIFNELNLANKSLQEEIELRKKIEIERETDIQSLQSALEEIKVLKDILPICMHCKKIRDDSGYWGQLETYLHKHSGIDFSHGICPDCMEEHYSEYNKKDSNPD